MSDQIKPDDAHLHVRTHTRIEIRPTLPEDVPALTSEPLPFRIKALTAVKDGQVIGVGGVGFRPDGIVVAFVQLTAEARRCKILLHKTALRFLAEVRAAGIRELVTLPEPGIAAAESWLVRLGFEPIERHGVKVYRWQTR